MKSIVLGLMLAAVAAFGDLSFAATKQVQDNYQFTYSITDEHGDHVSGQTVTLKIKKVSNGYFFDFADSSFKNSGWTQQSANLTEDSTHGYYYYTFNPPASETTEDSYQFVIDNASLTYGDHQSFIVDYLPDYETLIRRHGR